MATNNTLYLLDAMALAYRSHFIFISRPLINSKGQNTSATYGFASALLKLIEDHKIDHIAVVFDVMGEGGTFRDELYGDYKAHRDPPPEELLANIPVIKALVQAFDIPVVEREGFEADDVIGTLARLAEADGQKVVIVSPDKDFQQLISEKITQYRPAYRGEEFDPITLERFREKFGVEPIQFIDILALMGDTADNVPGVPGIGEKGAIQLVQEYGSVEALVERAPEIKAKRAREGLIEHREAALLSKKLVTIVTDLDVDLDWHQLRIEKPNLTEIDRICQLMEFGGLREKLLTKARMILGEEDAGTLFARPKAPAEPEVGQTLSLDLGAPETLRRHDPARARYQIVRNRQELEGVAKTLAAQPRFAFDTETTSVDAMSAALVGMSFAWEADQGVFIPTPLPDGTSTPDILAVIGPLLQVKKEKIGHNLKYDITVFRRHGVEVVGPYFDTMIAHYLLAPDEQHGLDFVAQAVLGYKMIPISDLIGTGKNQMSMRDVPLDQIGPYAAEDADIALQLADILAADLDREDLRKIADGIEFPLMDVLVEMEMTGVRVDRDVLARLSKQMEIDIAAFEKQIYEAAGESFNIGSPVQLGVILFDKLGLPVIEKTPKGQASTRERVLEELATEHPLPGLILDWRELAKLKSTYVDSLPELVNPETGRIHTNYNQTIAATGRLSSTNPNLQNIPVRTPQGQAVRKAFIPIEGHVLMAADYVQIELRILAHMSGDPGLKAAFEKGEDIHTATAALVYKIPIDQVTKDQRRKAKEVNYGIPYGISAFGLAQRLRCPRAEAQMLIDQYQQAYPAVAGFLAAQVEKAREKGYCETLLGRRRYVPNINARNRNERSSAERISVNMPIQGTQADMIKLAMIRIYNRLHAEQRAARMILQVHDELVLTLPPAEVDAIRGLVEHEMVNALRLDLPIEVDINVANNWLDAH
ncbi:MAG: DNA polymerase I [Rhodothermales bacterium]|nr:DNA polymerase I [Rhodothermales bacterium]